MAAMFWKRNTTETNRKILLHWAEAWNWSQDNKSPDREAFYDLFDEQCEFPSLENLGFPPTKAGFRQTFDTFLEGFPDLHIFIEEMFSDEKENKIACRVTERGTHTGTWQGIPATHKRVAFTEWVVYHFAGDRVIKWYYYPDMYSLLQQLGVSPIPDSSS